ncbi:hypothetical protein PIB30_034443 [Stylosanthes scabra]|uniref:Magnesium transporter n=1 Tax=Stylosanthes scabra TaxID=79078 RepID=A0ABU6SE07_9FABA|nr:hypothetical protein [Stylosanthes scabra]
MRRRRSGMRREWTVAVLQASGEMESLEAAGRQEIMRRTGVAARDLRRLVSSSSSRNRTTIVGRECSIVINLEHIKAIITANGALFLNSKDPSLIPLLQHLHDRIILPPSSPINILPFEFVALEACLQAASTALQNDANILEQESHTALGNLTLEICTLNLERVRQIKSRLVCITRRAQKVRDELENLLDDDEHMSEMYLTNKLAHRSLSSDSISSSNNHRHVNNLIFSHH